MREKCLTQGNETSSSLMVEGRASLRFTGCVDKPPSQASDDIKGKLSI